MYTTKTAVVQDDSITNTRYLGLPSFGKTW